MAISYYYHFQDEKPQLIGGEVLMKGYIKDSSTISSVETFGDRFTINLGSPQEHKSLVIEPGPPVTVTFRQFLGRRR
ncbi:MAG: hypothetical protein DMF62_11905 [Acidobacteria bacterium]|nr:MAG: hypothetical protein DMF62_11905 [Acidobacteriota bacterium]